MASIKNMELIGLQGDKYKKFTLPSLLKCPYFRNWSYLITCISLIEQKLYALFNVFNIFVLKLLCVFFFIYQLERGRIVVSLHTLSYVQKGTWVPFSSVKSYLQNLRAVNYYNNYNSNNNSSSSSWSYDVHTHTWWCVYVVSKERCEPMQFLPMSLTCEVMNMDRHTCCGGGIYLIQLQNSAGQFLLKCFIFQSFCA